ncbi:multicopper oxidase domain-containing protein [Planomonospora sp. ID91781]|uniref:multicopper oxidase domain-containing protein n=1 Tax=Planomonospora sp. ID91781 TaxID=2738135 RepID=UPI0018C35CA1|nr:multicopper oxidase domain-containing protein [Planomonospora sp. ID91781]
MRRPLIIAASALSAVLLASAGFGAGFGAGIATGESGHDSTPASGGTNHPESGPSGHEEDPKLTTEDGHDHAGHEGSKGTPATYDATAVPGFGFRPRDAVLPPAPTGRTHKATLTITEKVIEVAPGVRQRAWTYNGTLPGPVLRGRVGDTFAITLVNKGSTGHSIDFHASQVAPDRKMRTIEPGEQLTYTFTAERAGAFMYHCGSAPALHHIGNGMYGAIVIDPPNLPDVDQEFVVVQSELALGPQDGLAKLSKLYTADYDAVAFNGYAGQYRFAPLTATAGERTRIWVVDAGPSAPSAFHVVGAVFDTVFKDGGYTVRPDDTAGGGAQVLDLAPSQGGFVEFTFAEPGEYPVVSHRFADAARGATGLFKVGAA